jgi:transmembrane sensor
MLNQPEYLDLIVRYLNHPQDENIRAAINSYRTKSAEHEEYFHEVERIWNLSSKSASLNRLNIKQAQANFKRELIKRSYRQSNGFVWFRNIAATLILLGVGYWLYNLSSTPAYLTIKTAANQQDSVLLVDGSKVILAENSLVRYPVKFAASSREIYLDHGKAFFKIAKDSKHPFSVLMGESKVKVLGTSFNIDYSPSKIDLDVKTGRVLFSPYHNGTSSILVAGQALSYNITNKQFTTRISQNADSWLTKELVFVDTPLEEVCKQLSNYYQRNIVLETNQPLVKKFNATFKSNSLAEVLTVLKETYGFKIVNHKDTITLKTPIN